MLVIRLFRIGKKNQPSFKVVITEKQNPPRGGRFVEEVGFYNPTTKQKLFKKERIQYWISKGAKPSATLNNLFIKEGIITGYKIPLHKKSKKPASTEVPVVKPTSAPEGSITKPAPAPAEAPAAKEEKPKPVPAPEGATAGKEEAPNA